jgi:hypothetical protein
MQLYLYRVEAPPLSGEVNYRFSECRCQSQNLTTESQSSKTFGVHPRTKSLTLAFQQPGAGDNIRHSRSKFQFQSAGEANAVLIPGQEQGGELKLNRYYLNFRGFSLPDPHGDIAAEARQDRIQQYYYENICLAGLGPHSSVESLEEWKARGIYFHHRFPSGPESSSRVTVTTQFATLAVKPQVLLFDHWDKHISVSYSSNSSSTSARDDID